MRSNWLTLLPAWPYVARQCSHCSRPSLITDFKQHLLHKLCIETISFTPHASRTMFIRDFRFKNQQIHKSYIKIFTPQLKRWSPGHFAKYASITCCFVNHSLRPRHCRHVPTIHDTTGQCRYDSSTNYTSRFNTIASSTLLRRHVYRSFSRTFPFLRRYKSIIIHTPLIKRQNINTALYSLRLTLLTNTMRSLH